MFWIFRFRNLKIKMELIKIHSSKPEQWRHSLEWFENTRKLLYFFIVSVRYQVKEQRQNITFSTSLENRLSFVLSGFYRYLIANIAPCFWIELKLVYSKSLSIQIRHYFIVIATESENKETSSKSRQDCCVLFHMKEIRKINRLDR